MASARRAVCLAILALASAASPALARIACARDPRVVGPCFEVRGRLTLALGTPSTRIWIVGSKRLLGVKDAERPMVPDEIAAQLNGDYERAIFADFTVCPLTARRAGHMQMVCVEAARRVVVRDGSAPRE